MCGAVYKTERIWLWRRDIFMDCYRYTSDDVVRSSKCVYHFRKGGVMWTSASCDIAGDDIQNKLWSSLVLCVLPVVAA